MLGSLGKSWVGGAVAVVVIAVAGVILWSQMGGGPSGPGAKGDVLRICLKDGTKFLAPATRPGQKPPTCPTCGGETVVARVFECRKGHLFVGFLEKPPEPGAAKADDAYARHMPLLLRPGVDTTWTAGGAGRGPVCPVCGAGMKGPVLDLEGVGLDGIKVGKLPSAGGSE